MCVCGIGGRTGGTYVGIKEIEFRVKHSETALAVWQVADLKGCSSVLFFEARKKQDCYLWVAKTPAGPCAKFHVANGALSSNCS